MLEPKFFLAGRAVFTIEVGPDYLSSHDCKPHYTYRITYKAANGQWPEKWFIKYLGGPDNTKDYFYLGEVNLQTGAVRLTSKSCVGADSYQYKMANRVLQAIFRGDGSRIIESGWDVHHEGKCCRCGRALTVPESIESGIGPECAKKVA